MKPPRTSKQSKREMLKERLGPGIWVDQEDNLHISGPELIQAFDLPDTPEMHAYVMREVRAMLIKQHSGHHVTIVERTGKCPRCDHWPLTCANGKINCPKCGGAWDQEQLKPL